MRKIRIVASILSLAMVTSMLAACGGDKNKSGVVKEYDPNYEYETGFEVKLSGYTGTTENWNDTYIVKLLEDKFGVSIEAAPHSRDIWATKWNLMMAEDDMPDMVTNAAFTLAQVSEWGADGYLLPINEYLNHMPNLASFFESHPDYKVACTSPDGNIYGLQMISENIYNNVTRTFINEEWLNRVGKKYPTNLDELYDVLKAFKEKDANGNGDPHDEIPFAWTENYSRKALHNILNACGIVAEKNTANAYGILEVDKKEKVYLADTTDNYRYFLTYMNKLWEEGLCLDTAYTSTKAEVQAMSKKDLLGMFSEASSVVVMSENDENPSARWEYVGGLTSEVNDVPIIGATNTITNEIKTVISADTEHPAEICRIIDFFFSEEGIRAAKGAEWYVENIEEIGSKWYYDKENPIIIEGLEDYPMYEMAEECNNNVPAGFENWSTYFLQKCYINGGFDMVGYIDPNSVFAILPKVSASDEICDNLIEANYEAWIAQIHKRINDPGEAEIKFGYPIMVYDSTIAGERASIWTDINLLCQTAQAQFITGEKDVENDAHWNEFIKNLEKAGLKRLLEIEQTSYDALYK